MERQDFNGFALIILAANAVCLAPIALKFRLISIRFISRWRAIARVRSRYYVSR